LAILPQPMKPTVIRSLGEAFSWLPKTLLGTKVGIATELAAALLRSCRRVTLGSLRISSPLKTVVVRREIETMPVKPRERSERPG
jgi:hypothetical protein